MPSFSSSISLLPLVLFVFYPLIQGEGYGRYQTRDLTGTDPSALNCSSSNSGAGKASLGLYHRYGPCARPLQEDYTMPSMEDVWLHDKLRIQSLMKKQGSEEGSVNGREALEIPNRMYGAGGIYVVEIGLGTPAVLQLVNFDTGSDLTWVQCSPCQICLPQDPNYPIFAGKSSSTYGSVPCNDPRCPSPSPETGDYKCSTTGTCMYNVSYGDQSTSVGDLATDRLTLATPGNSLQDFVFGCGTSQSGSYSNASGILGLSPSPVSIVNQTLLSFAGVFSYCLPASRQSTGHLTFGVSENVVYQYVPMVASPTGLPDLYFVNLMGISVRGIALQIPETEFLTPSGTFIDSGSTFTSIPQSAYELLRGTFITQVSNLNPGVVPVDDTPCYKSSDLSQMNIPNITLVISQVDILLEETQIFWQEPEGTYCLAFQANKKPHEDPNVIGYVNQRQLEVAYDIVNQRIGFADGTC